MDKARQQEMFDKSTRGIIAQGKPAIRQEDGYWTCVYRDADGCKCGIGQLIEAKDYNSTWEGKGAHIIVRDLKWEVITEADLGFDLLKNLKLRPYTKLQECHDNAALEQYAHGEEPKTYKVRPRDLREFWQVWKANLHQYALEYGLNEDILKEIPIGIDMDKQAGG